MKKRQSSSKMQSVIIAILAILLVGIMTTGVTYAFFTDKDNASDKLTFGTIKIADIEDDTIVDFSGTQTPSRTELMPGDTISTTFDITLDANSEDAWVRFKLLASVSEKTYAGVLGFASYVETDLLHNEDEEVIENVYLVLNGEEYVIAGGTTVSKYVEDAPVALDAEEDAAEIAEVIAAAGRYVTEFTIGEDEYTIAFVEDKPEAEVVGVKANVTKNDAALDAAVEEQAKDIEVALAAASRAVVRIADVEEAITLLNEAIAAEQVGDFYGTTVITTDDQTGTTTVERGDGWLYKKTKLTNSADVANGHTVEVDYTYTIPRKTTGNALQGVQVDFALVVEAVQYDNNTNAENDANNGPEDPAVDISEIGVDGVDATTNEAAECIKAFYAVEHEIVEAP